MAETPLVVAFTLGLFSTVHCWGMCGGIIGALGFALPASTRHSRWRVGAYALSYNLGRISSYTVFGLAAGALGTALLVGAGTAGNMLLRVIAALVLAGIGLYLAGWFPRFAGIEKAGAGLWRRLQPLGRRLLPVDNLGKAYAFGLIWGWLPCGLVYSALVWSTTAGSAGRGGLYMLAFGLGTLPGMVAAGVFSGSLLGILRRVWIRRTVGIALIMFAGATLFLPMGHHQHANHAGHVMQAE